MKCTALVIGLLLVATIAVLCAVTVRKTSSKSCNNIDRVHLYFWSNWFRPSTAEERRKHRCEKIKERENKLMNRTVR